MMCSNIGAGSGGYGSVSQSHTGAVVTKTAAQANAGNQPPQYSNPSSNTFTDADAAAFAKANPYDDPDVSAARKLYISDSNPNNDGYSHSQNLNYKLDNDIKLNATEKYIDDNIQDGMAAIGKEATMVRFCHDDIIRQCGISDYSKLSQSQLQSRLVGTELQTTSYLSTSYDASRSPFAPNAPKGGGREVTMRLKTATGTKVMLGARKQTEVIVNKGTNIRITGVHFDGTTAYPRTGKAMPRIVLDVECF